MIKISLREIHDGMPHLIALSSQYLELDVSIVISQALAICEQQQKAINKALTDKAALMGFQLSQLPNEPPKLIEPTAENDYTVPAETIKQFDADAEAFLNSQFIDVPIKKITLDQLRKSKAQTTPNMLTKLGWLFDLFSNDATQETKPKRGKVLELAKHA